MTITPKNFRIYAGWPIPGSVAFGLLTLTRDDQTNDARVISFKTDEGRFTTPGNYNLVFTNTEHFYLNESAKYVEFGAKCIQKGVEGNIPAMSLWNRPRRYIPASSIVFDPSIQSNTSPDPEVTGVTLNNPAAFQGGDDDYLIRNLSESVAVSRTPDQQIQNYLDIAVSVILDLLGFSQDEDLPDHVRVENAVNFLCLYFIENQSSQERVSNFELQGFITQRKTSYYRANLEPMIYKRVVSLISPWRRNWKFVPPYTDPNLEASA